MVPFELFWVLSSIKLTNETAYPCCRTVAELPRYCQQGNRGLAAAAAKAAGGGFRVPT